MAKKSPKTKFAVECGPTPYKQTKEDIARQKRYEAEDAMRTLTRADEIRNNPSLMKSVREVAKEQVKAVSKFTK